MEALLREWRHDEELSEARRWPRPVRIPYEEAASRRAWSVFIGAHGLTAARTVCHDRSPPSHLGQGHRRSGDFPTCQLGPDRPGERPLNWLEEA
jgi:hypothetical protein